jgi:small-conductance mechanosensitive channel
MRISSKSTFIANAIGFVLMPALILHIFDMLPMAIEYLDSLSFVIGSIKISLYLVIKAFIVALTVFWLASLISKKSRNYIEKNREIQSNTKGIIIKFVDILIYTGVIIILLKTFGVDMTAFAVVGGAIGVGIGFGLQKIASNFISGIILLFEKSVEIGDLIELENGNMGKIKRFSGRYTLLEMLDGKEIFMPNEDLITGKVINWTHTNSQGRVEINLGVAYGSDLEFVKQTMISCAKSHPKCLLEPEIECFVTEFSDFDIKFTLYFWIADMVEGRAAPKSDVLIKIWQEFEKHEIKIPLPQREVRIRD